MNRKERRAESKKKSNKWIVISLGAIVGLSHIGMIGIQCFTMNLIETQD